jgi:hypothetical protein
MKGYQMESKSGLLEVVRLIVNPGDEIINGALAQDAGQASVMLDDGVVGASWGSIQPTSLQLKSWDQIPSC